MATEHLEIERKYDVSEATLLPPLHELRGVARVEQPDEQELDAVYFDTADLVLAAAGVTLRRRTGGTDEGWHLKLPTAGERLEVRRPLGRAVKRVPVQLARLVRVHVRHRELVPVAALRTHRTVHRLIGDDGTVLAELCDDRVNAARLGAGPEGGPAPVDGDRRAWREWELELVGGPLELLADGAGLLAAAGATPAAGPSKLARALGDRIPPAVPVGRAVPKAAGVADAFTAYTGAQVAAIRERDPDVRRDQPDAVHKMRVATRRLRSALATYRTLLDRPRAEFLRAELKWLAGELAGARDSEVLRERLAEQIAAEPIELVMGRVARTVDGHLRAAYRDARVRALTALDSDRYFALLDELERFVADPPWTGDRAGGGAAAKVLPGLLHRDWQRVRRAVECAEQATDPAERDHQLHEARKAAKRLRYAAESALPVFGKRAKELAATAEGIQEVLGEHQDSVVSQDLLRQLGVQVYLGGGNAFSYGRLHGLEQARGAQAQELFWQQWNALDPPRPKSWS